MRAAVSSRTAQFSPGSDLSLSLSLSRSRTCQMCDQCIDAATQSKNSVLRTGQRGDSPARHRFWISVSVDPPPALIHTDGFPKVTLHGLVISMPLSLGGSHL